MKILNLIFLAISADFVPNFVEIFDQPVPKYNENCDSLDAAKMCESECGNVLMECAYECQTTECGDQCKADFFKCTDSCPCHSECPDGCIGCDSWACHNECFVPEENESKIQVLNLKTFGDILKNILYIVVRIGSRRDIRCLLRRM